MPLLQKLKYEFNIIHFKLSKLASNFALKLISRYNPQALAMARYEYVSEKHTKMKIKFISSTIHEHAIDYGFEIMVNDRTLASHISIDMYEMDYFKHHPKIFRHIVIRQIMGLFDTLVDDMVDDKMITRMLHEKF